MVVACVRTSRANEISEQKLFGMNIIWRLFRSRLCKTEFNDSYCYCSCTGIRVQRNPYENDLYFETLTYDSFKRLAAIVVHNIAIVFTSRRWSINTSLKLRVMFSAGKAYSHDDELMYISCRFKCTAELCTCVTICMVRWWWWWGQKLVKCYGSVHPSVKNIFVVNAWTQ